MVASLSLLRIRSYDGEIAISCIDSSWTLIIGVIDSRLFFGSSLRRLESSWLVTPTDKSDLLADLLPDMLMMGSCWLEEEGADEEATGRCGGLTLNKTVSSVYLIKCVSQNLPAQNIGVAIAVQLMAMFRVLCEVIQVHAEDGFLIVVSVSTTFTVRFA